MDIGIAIIDSFAALYDKYIDESAHFMVNISSSCRNKLKKQFKIDKFTTRSSDENKSGNSFAQHTSRRGSAQRLQKKMSFRGKNIGIARLVNSKSKSSSNNISSSKPNMKQAKDAVGVANSSISCIDCNYKVDIMPEIKDSDENARGFAGVVSDIEIVHAATSQINKSTIVKEFLAFAKSGDENNKFKVGGDIEEESIKTMSSILDATLTKGNNCNVGDHNNDRSASEDSNSNSGSSLNGLTENELFEWIFIKLIGTMELAVNEISKLMNDSFFRFRSNDIAYDKAVELAMEKYHNNMNLNCAHLHNNQADENHTPAQLHVQSKSPKKVQSRSPSKACKLSVAKYFHSAYTLEPLKTKRSIEEKNSNSKKCSPNKQINEQHSLTL